MSARTASGDIARAQTGASCRRSHQPPRHRSPGDMATSSGTTRVVDVAPEVAKTRDEHRPGRVPGGSSRRGIGADDHACFHRDQSPYCVPGLPDDGDR